MDQVETFVYVHSTSDESDSLEEPLPYLDGCLVPAIRRSQSRDTSKHVGVGPGLHPWVHVSESHGCPGSINGGEDEEDPVSHGVGEFGRVLGEERCPGMEGCRRPSGTGFNGVKELGNPLERQVA